MTYATVFSSKAKSRRLGPHAHTIEWIIFAHCLCNLEYSRVIFLLERNRWLTLNIAPRFKNILYFSGTNHKFSRETITACEEAQLQDASTLLM